MTHARTDSLSSSPSQGYTQHPRQSTAVTQRKARASASDITGRDASFAQGERALMPRENAIQMKAGAKASKEDIYADCDRTFDKWWAHYHYTKEGIAKAEAQVRKLGEGGVPKDWVPPPLRGTGRLPESPNYHPDASNSSQAPGPCDEPDLSTGQTVDPSVGQGQAPKGGQAQAPKGGSAASRAGTSVGGSVTAPVTDNGPPADTPMSTEAPIKKTNIFGAELGIKVDGTQQTGGVKGIEISLVKKNADPIAIQGQTPIPGVFAEGEVEWKAGFFGKGDSRGKWEAGGVAAADARVTMNLGIPGGMSVYAGGKLTGEIKLSITGSYDLSNLDKPVTVDDGGLTATLSGAFVAGGKIDKAGVRLEKEFGKTEFGVLTWMYSTGSPQVTPSSEVKEAIENAKARLEQAQAAGEAIVDGVKDAAGWIWDKLSGPAPTESQEERDQAEQEQRDSHSDTDDGASGSHG